MSEKQSLAQFISDLREKRGLSISGMALKSSVSLKELEDIESGQVLFLPSTIRQKIARVLKVNPSEIKEYEKDVSLIQDVSENCIEKLKNFILDGETQNLTCPLCGSALVCRVERMFDLEDNLVLNPKAHCSKCSFIIK